MHSTAYHMVESFLRRTDWVGSLGVDVLDVGSMDINGTLRPLIEGQGWNYLGLDIVPGPNVDVVSEDPYHYPFPDNSFHVVLSAGTMEHVGAIWEWVPELVRLLRPGGLLAIVTHWQWPEHCFPVDCWRIMPGGMYFILSRTGLLEDIHVVTAPDGTIGASAFRRHTFVSGG